MIRCSLEFICFLTVFVALSMSLRFIWPMAYAPSQYGLSRRSLGNITIVVMFGSDTVGVAVSPHNIIHACTVFSSFRWMSVTLHCMSHVYIYFCISYILRQVQGNWEANFGCQYHGKFCDRVVVFGCLSLFLMYLNFFYELILIPFRLFFKPGFEKCEDVTSTFPASPNLIFL